MTPSPPEVWLRGPVSGVPPLLQPAAHALLQAGEEIRDCMAAFPAERLWERPAGVASVGFHLLHITGVLNRLGTYAKGQGLSDEQLQYLQQEDEPQGYNMTALLEALERQLTSTIHQLKQTPEARLTEPRRVGRKGLPSTVQGLLFHAAEHTMRHLGQLLVTARLLSTS